MKGPTNGVRFRVVFSGNGNQDVQSMMLQLSDFLRNGNR